MFFTFFMEEKVSVLILSKNNQDVIGDAIKSVKDIASEVILVDDSDDDTPKIAREQGAKVVENRLKNFADQRNLAAGLAKNEWIFYLDSDERATPEFIESLKSKISLASARDKQDPKPDVAGFWVARKTFFYGKDWHFKDQVQRVFRKSKLRSWRGIVHETPEVDGRLEAIDAPILHYTHRNFEQMVDKTNNWSLFEANLRLAAGHPAMNVWRFVRVMFTAFFSSYFGRGGYKNGTAGVVEAIYQAFSMFITYAKLWERTDRSE